MSGNKKHIHDFFVSCVYRAVEAVKVGKKVQKKVVKKYFCTYDMGCAKCAQDLDKHKSDSCQVMKVSIQGCRRPQRALSDVNFSSFWTLRAVRPYIHHRRWWIRNSN